MNLPEFGKQLQALRKARQWSQEALLEALDKLARAGPPAEYRVIDSRLLSRWERAHSQKGRTWKPTRTYILHLIHLFSPYLDLTRAAAWAAHAGYTISPGELQAWFPLPITPPQPALAQPPATAFIGRETELAALAALLADPSVRLLTIVGAGGVGKTRLAMETGRRHLVQVECFTRFNDGVFFVPLAALVAAEHIAPAVAEGLGLQLGIGPQTRSVEQQVADYLQAKSLLLILDNYEHLLDGAGVVARLLAVAPKLKVLVTSRERLHLQGEQLYPIQGLAFRDGETLADVAQQTAVQLFVQSARRVRPDFELRMDEVTTLTRICRLVDGVPLALELAAGWAELLSLAEIAQEIQQSLDFLETENRDVPERQRSMRAVFENSWWRLSQAEQSALAQLAVFRGGFTRESAQQVAGASLRILAALVAKSLVQVNGERTRYTIHELVRQYSAQQLALRANLEAEVCARHSLYYSATLHQLEAELMGSGQLTALAEIEREHENMRASWEWARQNGRVANLAQSIEALALFYEMRGRYQEGKAVCQAAVAQQAVQSDPSLYVRSLTWLASFAQLLGEPTVARQFINQSKLLLESGVGNTQERDRQWATLLLVMANLAYAEGRGDDAKEFAEQSLVRFAALQADWHVAKAGLRLCMSLTNFNRSGEIAVRHQQLLAAKQVAQESLAIYRRLHDRAGIAALAHTVGWVIHNLGMMEEALALQTESLAIYEQLALQGGISSAHYHLTITYAGVGDNPKMRHHAEAAVALARELGDQVRLGLTLITLGRAVLMDRAWHEADCILQEAVTMNRKNSPQNFLAGALAYLAYADFRQGRRGAMYQHLHEALQISYQSRLVPHFTISLPLIALLLVERGEIERAVELYAQALAYHCNNYPHRWYEDMVGQQIAAAATTLPAEVVAAAKARGRQRNLWANAEELLKEITRWG